MKNSAKKLPGKNWRILSFIPAINWISLLYIGIINSNTLFIVFAIVYCVCTFAIPSTSWVFWIFGIIHYALAYNDMKNKLNNSAQTPSAPSNANLYSANKERVFSDFTISGETERKQAIPRRLTPVDDNIQVYYSGGTSQEEFFQDMRKYAAFEGHPATFVPFMTYWPTYGSMNKQQQAWYFYWRSQVRLGNYSDTDLSYIFIYIYELLSGIGWNTPQEGYTLLNRIWGEYQKVFLP